jgi:hypothetical protein
MTRVMTRPEIGDFSDEGRLYTFLLCANSSSSSWKCQKLAAEPPLLGQAIQPARAGGTDHPSQV